MERKRNRRGKRTRKKMTREVILLNLQTKSNWRVGQVQIKGKVPRQPHERQAKSPTMPLQEGKKSQLALLQRLALGWEQLSELTCQLALSFLHLAHVPELSVGVLFYPEHFVQFQLMLVYMIKCTTSTTTFHQPANDVCHFIYEVLSTNKRLNSIENTIQRNAMTAPFYLHLYGQMHTSVCTVHKSREGHIAFLNQCTAGTCFQ